MFRASNMSRAARQAAKANGLATVGSFEIVDSQTRIISAEHPQFTEQYETVVIVAHSPKNKKQVEITAGDLWEFETMFQGLPMARIA